MRSRMHITLEDGTGVVSEPFDFDTIQTGEDSDAARFADGIREGDVIVLHTEGGLAFIPSDRVLMVEFVEEGR